MPTKAPVNEACSPRPPSSEMTEASSGGPAGCHSSLRRRKRRWRSPAGPWRHGRGREELLGRAVDLDGEVDGAVGDRSRRVEGEGELPSGQSPGQDRMVRRGAEGRVVADGEEVELVPVVVGREARRLLVGVGPKGGEPGFGAAVVLLAARDEGLLEPGADRLAGVEAERLAGQGENPLRGRGAKPLEVRRQRRAGEAVLDRAVGLGLGGAGGAGPRRRGRGRRGRDGASRPRPRCRAGARSRGRAGCGACRGAGGCRGACGRQGRRGSRRSGRGRRAGAAHRGRPSR